MTHDQQFELIVGIAIFVFFLTYFIVYVFFILSLQKTLRLIPTLKQTFPSWFCWLMLVPFIGFVFTWIMIPFGIPDAIKNNQTDNPAALAEGKRLFGIGLAMMILMSISPFLSILAIITFIPMLVLWILYWVNIVSIRKILQPPVSQT